MICSKFIEWLIFCNLKTHVKYDPRIFKLFTGSSKIKLAITDSRTFYCWKYPPLILSMSFSSIFTVWLSGSLKLTTKLCPNKSLKVALFVCDSFKQIHKKFINWLEYLSFKNLMYCIVLPESVLSLLVRSVYCKYDAISTKIFSEWRRQHMFCFSTSFCPFSENRYFTES